MKAQLLITGEGYPDPELSSAGPTPLGGILAEHLKGYSYDEFKIVLIGTREGDKATAPVVSALSRAIDSCVTELGWVTPERSIKVDEVLLDNLDDHGLRRRLVEAGVLGKHSHLPASVDMLVTIAGAQMIWLQTLAVGVACGATLFAYWQTEAAQPGGESTVHRWDIPDSAGAAQSAWLYRLGYPDLAENAAESSGLEPSDDQREALETEAEALLAVGQGHGSAEQLATWAMIDLRRMDGFEGLALRGWLEAQYGELLTKERLTSAHAPDPLAIARERVKRERIRTARGGGHVSLARALVEISRWPTESPCLSGPQGEFLKTASGYDFLQSAGPSNHRGVYLTATQRREAMEFILGQAASMPAARNAFGRIRPATGRLALVTPVPSRLLGKGEPLEAEHFSSDVLKSCGVMQEGDVVSLNYLMLATDEFYAEAICQKTALETVATQHLDLSVAIKTCLMMSEAAHTITLDWLNELAPVDAIVVAPVGSRELTLGILSAALEYGATAAIPVWIDWANDTNHPLQETHQLTRHLGVDSAVLPGAIAALNTLNLGTAARLLSLGSQPLVDNSLSIDKLRKELFPNNNEGTGTAGLLSIAAEILTAASSINAAEAARVFHIAVEQAKSVLRPRGGVTVAARSTMDGVSPEEQDRAEALVSLAIKARDLLRFNHGPALEAPQSLDELVALAAATAIRVNERRLLEQNPPRTAVELLNALKGFVVRTQRPGQPMQQEQTCRQADKLLTKWTNARNALKEAEAKAAESGALRQLHSVVTAEEYG